MTAILALIDLIPRWVLLAVIAALAALSVSQEFSLSSSRRDTIRANEHVAIMEKLMLEAANKAAEDSRAMQEKVTEAQNEARKRETLLRASADSARSELDGLRGELDASRDQLANASRDALVERTTAVSLVLKDCSRRYIDLAQKSDRHVSDIRTLMDAWPK